MPPEKQLSNLQKYDFEPDFYEVQIEFADKTGFTTMHEGDLDSCVAYLNDRQSNKYNYRLLRVRTEEIKFTVEELSSAYTRQLMRSLNELSNAGIEKVKEVCDSVLKDRNG